MLKRGKKGGIGHDVMTTRGGGECTLKGTAKRNSYDGGRGKKMGEVWSSSEELTPWGSLEERQRITVLWFQHN